MRVAKVLQQLKAARQATTCETASFAMPHEKVILNGVERGLDALIKDRIRLHHKTWIIAELDAAIAEIERDRRTS